MDQDSVSLKLIAIAVIGGACFVASLFVMALTEERQDRFSDAKEEIASSWGGRQMLTGPMIVADIGGEVSTHAYVLPENVKIESTLTPETRSRGIFDVVVYTSNIKISGEFAAMEIARVGEGSRTAVFSLPMTDKRGG